MTNDEVLRKMAEDVDLRKLSRRTSDSYHNAAGRFLEFTGKPNYYDLDQDDLRSYLLHIRSKESGLAITTTNQYNAGCKFLLRVVMRKPVDDTQVPNARGHHKQCRPFSVEELMIFFSLVHDIEDLAFFLTLYGTGARTSEIRHITTDDVKTENGTGEHFLVIEHGKRDKERRIPLPDACYDALTLYWKKKRPVNPDKWMFPACNLKDAAGPQYFTTRFNNIREQDIRLSGLTQHSMRHAFATHYLQHSPNAVNFLQFLMGHSSRRSTEIYVDLALLFRGSNDRSPAEICAMILSAWCRKHGLAR